MKKTFENWAYHDCTIKLSVSIAYTLIVSVTLNFFYQPGHVCSSGTTDLAQILTVLSKSLMGFEVPVLTTLCLLNIPLFILAWFKIGKKFTTSAFITIALTSLCIHILPETVLSTDPIIYALFGGTMMELGIRLTLRDGLSSSGLDIVSIAVRKKTGKPIDSTSIYFSTLIVFVAGILFGRQYMFYNTLFIFVSGRVTDVVYTEQKKVQVMIVTKYSEKIVNEIQNCICRGITTTNETEGAYKHNKQTALMTIVTRYELPLLGEAVKASDPQTFVSIAENAQIFGRFYEDGI